MCGIVGYKGKQQPKEILIEGLKNLEYRGYDSSGIALKDGNEIQVIRSVGKISCLEEKVNSEKLLDARMGIAHTRWATHGAPSDVNSHPHASNSGKIAVVHNGIIENYQELIKEYLGSIKLNSETDTEVIVQLMDIMLKEEDILGTFRTVVSMLKGSFAIVLIVAGSDTVYFARNCSPMVISKSGSSYLISSDINGFEDKSAVYYIPDNSIGYIGNTVVLFDNNYSPIEIKWENYTRESSLVDKGGYPHFMIKEIMEIPSSLRRSYESFKTVVFKLPRVIDNILIVACGTSYHSGLMGAKYIEKYSGKKCECIIASEFIYNDYIVRDNTIAIFISQSGETADTIKAIHKCKDLRLFTMAITNVVGSTISRLVDSCIYEDVGAEICVASTKAYTSQVLMLLLLSNVLINLDKGSYPTVDSSEFVYYNGNLTNNYLDFDIVNLFEMFNIDIGEMVSAVDAIMDNLYGKEQIFLIGKDFDYITAMEGALKIKEVSYVFTDAYPCGELKHGTLALIEEGSIVISLITREVIVDKCLNSMREIGSRGGECIVLSQLDLDTDARSQIRLPKLCPLFMSFVGIIPIDLIAYRLSVSRGYNPDKPRNLAKSVTVE